MKFLKKYFEIVYMIPWPICFMMLTMCACYIMMPKPDAGFLIWGWMFIVIGYMIGYKRTQ